MSLEEFLAPYSPEVRLLFLNLRNLVLSEIHACEEVLHPGWKNLSFCHPGKRTPVVYLAPLSNSVNLGFYRGTEIPDPMKLLRGTGKKLRHIKFKSSGDHLEKSVISLISEAFHAC
jgi:hypothetical protein